MYRAAIGLLLVALVPSVGRAQQPCTTDARHVVEELYRHMLERDAGSASEGWVRQLESGQLTVRDVVRAIVMSPEHMQRFIYTEPGEPTPYARSVARLYRHILGRQPDQGGEMMYARVAQQRGPKAVIDSILQSVEYNRRFGDWGVPGSGGIRLCAPAGTQVPQLRAGIVSEPWLRSADVNDDGVVTRREWPGDRRTFRRRDTNRDGVLSGTELAGAVDSVDSWSEMVATTGQSIVIDPRQRWVDTGLDVRAGDVLLFDVAGTIQMSGNANDIADPGGARSGRHAAQAPLPAAPAGALIGVAGGGAPFFVGDRRSVTAPASGHLYLGVNDDHLADNSGAYYVTVAVR